MSRRRKPVNMLNFALSAVAVLLLLTTVTAQTVIVRLVDGPGPHAGRLEVYYNGTRGTVCYDYFDNADARVVCYMLGYFGGEPILNRYGAGSGTIWLDDVQCRGTETNIANCRHRGWGRHNCGHSSRYGKDVSVSCSTTVRLMRLVGSSSPREGRLEVYLGNSIWRTACDDYFNDTAAEVVCYMLGYKRGGRHIGLVTTTLPLANDFGWATFSVRERKRAAQTVNTTDYAVRTVHTEAISPCRASVK